MTLIQFETLEEKLERRREECIQLHSVLADHTHKKRKRCRKRLTGNMKRDELIITKPCLRVFSRYHECLEAS